MPRAAAADAKTHPSAPFTALYMGRGESAFSLHPSVFFVGQAGSMSRYIPAQFELYPAFELIKFFMSPFVSVR